MTWGIEDAQTGGHHPYLFNVGAQDTSGLEVVSPSPAQLGLSPLSSDDLIPMLIVALIRVMLETGAPMVAILRYMVDFATWNAVDKGEWGFVAGCVESALEWLREVDAGSSMGSGIGGNVESGKTQLRRTDSKEWITMNFNDQETSGLLASGLPGYAELEEISNWNGRWWNAIESGDVAMCRSIMGEYNDRVGRENQPDILPHFVTARDSQGNDSVLLATRSSHPDMVRFLTEATPSGLELPAHTVNFDLETPLHVAVMKGDVETLRALLACFPKRERALSHPALTVLDEVSALLLQCGANPNSTDLSGRTVFHIGNPAMLKTLYEHGALWDVAANDGATPLLYRCVQKDVEGMVALLDVERHARMGDRNRVQNGIEWNVGDMGGRTPAHFVAFRGGPENEALLEMMLDLGLPLAKEDRTPSGHEEQVIAKPFLNLNALTLRSNTPLHAACETNQMAIVRMLVETGLADPTIRNMYGKTPSEVASSDEVKDFVEGYALLWHDSDKQNVRNGGNEETPPVENTHSSDRKVAAVVRCSYVDGSVLFTVKTGVPPNVESITTVKRTIGDFVMLRSQLLEEHPAICLPELRDLSGTQELVAALTLSTSSYLSDHQDVLSPSVTTSPIRGEAAVIEFQKSGLSPRQIEDALQVASNQGSANRAIKRIIRRLNRFLQWLLRHPLISANELVWEFLVLPEIDWQQIQNRTLQRKLDLVDTILDEYPPVFRDAGVAGAYSEIEYIGHFFKEQEQKLVDISTASTMCAVRAKLLSKTKRSLASSVSVLAHQLGRPTGLAFERETARSSQQPRSAKSYSGYRGSVAELSLRGLEHVLKEESTRDAWDLSQSFQETVLEIQGTKGLLRRHDDAATSFLDSVRATQKLEVEVTKLETEVNPANDPATTNPDEMVDPTIIDRDAYGGTTNTSSGNTQFFSSAAATLRDLNPVLLIDRLRPIRTQPKEHLIAKLSERTAEHARMEREMTRLGSLLRFVDTAGKEELDSFHRERSRGVIDALDQWVRWNVVEDSKALDFAEEALQLMHRINMDDKF
ncbi:ankyrin [Gonapodya prolifera JEL478]|uniref:Ankyrin n=1 Tax=Gonapodya prolifera (strain JEL478) TaxID=1344416 RepID=A0A139AT29_GONPJ|nr:ankyrin [Gonapodya prolifera JEL478]|eukprot:KXS19881.1 ankyrin [Gonapodya prolifera JEL478]